MEGPNRGPKKPGLVDPRVQEHRDQWAAQLRAGRRERDALTREEKGVLHAAKRFFVPARAERREQDIAAAKDTLREGATELLAQKEIVAPRDEETLLQETVYGPMDRLFRQGVEVLHVEGAAQMTFAESPKDEELAKAIHLGNLSYALKRAEDHNVLIPKLSNLYRSLLATKRLPQLRAALAGAVFENMESLSTLGKSEDDAEKVRWTYVKLIDRLLAEPAFEHMPLPKGRETKILSALQQIVPSMDHDAAQRIVEEGHGVTRFLFALPEKDKTRTQFVESLGGISDSLLFQHLLLSGPKAAEYGFEKYGETFAQTYGVSLREMFDLNRNPKGYKEIALYKFFEACSSLEKSTPGSVKRLFKDYGIREFYRYPEEMLLSQLQEEKVDRPYGVIMFPYADNAEEIAAFDNERTEFKALFESVKAHHGVKIFEVASSRDVARHLLHLGKAYEHKIDFAILGGHGAPDNIEFSQFGSLTSEHLAGPGHRRAKDFFSKDATLILDSCSTGQAGGIAERMRDSLGIMVIAPNDVAGTASVSVVERDGKLDFTVAYQSPKEEEVRAVKYRPEEV